MKEPVPVFSEGVVHVALVHATAPWFTSACGRMISGLHSFAYKRGLVTCLACLSDPESLYRRQWHIDPMKNIPLWVGSYTSRHSIIQRMFGLEDFQQTIGLP